MNKNNRLIYILALLKFILPFVLVPSFYQAHRDEYLYMTEGKHLAWGFMEVPPMLAILAWINHFFGEGLFLIKFWPAIFGAGTFILTARIVSSLGGKTFAILLAFLPFIFTGYIRLFYLFHPNFLDAFFWTLNAYALFYFINTTKNSWLYLFGISVGLGMMSKYSTAFYTLSLLAGLVFSQHRTIFLNKHLYFGGILALCIFFPNMYWQYKHQFPVIAHMKELQEEQLQFQSPIKFIIGQLLMLLPCLFLWLRGLLYLLFNKKGSSYRIFGLAYLFVITLLIFLQGKDYYAIGAYPILIAFGSYQFEQYAINRSAFVKYSPIAICILLGLFIYPLLLPIANPALLSAYYQKTGLNKSGAFEWEDHKKHTLPQDFADMLGWREVAIATGKVYQSLSLEEQKNTMVYCRGYYFAGALNYYAKEAGLPEVYSDNASFLIWMPKKYQIKNLLVLAHNIPEKDDVVFQQFEKMTVKDSLINPYFRESGIKIILYQNGNDSLNSYIEKGIATQRLKFNLQ